MESNEKHVTIQKTARYYTYGILSEKTKSIWIVFHGYGQLSEYFIKKFESLEPTQNYVIAPEGLSKFYLSGFTGRIGATWMTLNMREQEIADYLNFIDAVVQKECPTLENYDLNVLGFSQGCHTACRWVVENKLKPKKLVLWSGGIPNEYADLRKTFDGIPVHLFMGDKDKLMTDMHFQAVENAKAHIPDFQIIEFEGGHELSPKLFERYFAAATSPE